MHSDSSPSKRADTRQQIVLDGEPVTVPPLRRSLAAIRSFLETKALERQRVLCAFMVDGEPVSTTDCLQARTGFAKIEGKSIDLNQLPLQLITMARNQVAKARDQISSAVISVLINDSRVGREHWWDLARDLKQPLLTLSLMPSSACGSSSGGASLMQLRKWQLQQLATIIKDVDETCWSVDPTSLSNALERRVLPWLDGLRATLDLWHETLTVWSEAQPGAGGAHASCGKTKLG